MALECTLQAGVSRPTLQAPSQHGDGMRCTGPRKAGRAVRRCACLYQFNTALENLAIPLWVTFRGKGVMRFNFFLFFLILKMMDHFYEGPGRVKFLETESRMVGPRGWRAGRIGGECLKGPGFQFRVVEKLWGWW